MSNLSVRYINNITKEYPDMIKVTIYKTPRIILKTDNHAKRGAVPDDYEPSYQSLARTKSLIQDVILCNDFDWFITFTFNPDKVDSFNYNSCLGTIQRWIHNQKEKCPDMKYLIVPEQHKSGRWHFHAVFSHFNGSMRRSGYKTATGRDVYNVTCFRSGFTTAVPIDSKENVARYVTKYITKDLLKKFNRKRFVCSKNLSRPIKEINSVTFSITPPLFRRKYYESDEFDCYVLPSF